MCTILGLDAPVRPQFLRPYTQAEQIVRDSTGSRRFPMLVLSGFALFALVLPAIGIAGVVSFSVTQRTREIGLLVALGARTIDVLSLHKTFKPLVART
jgi:hypothetical protein